MPCSEPRTEDRRVKRVIEREPVPLGAREARDRRRGFRQSKRQKRVKRVIAYPPLFPARPLKRNSEECPSLGARRLRIADHALHALYALEAGR